MESLCPVRGVCSDDIRAAGFVAVVHAASVNLAPEDLDRLAGRPADDARRTCLQTERGLRSQT